MKAKKATTFLGRLFYAIVPNKDNKSVTFHFTKANASEGRSVARGLPHFIRDHFKLEPAFFCTSMALTEAMEGDWNMATRKFLSAQEKMEVDRLEDMEGEVNAVPIAFISKDHQQALAMDDDEVSVETRLTKGDAAPTPTILLNEAPDEQSEMTGSTRESKAKKYADEAVKEVISEYSGTIINMSSDINKKDDRIAQLELMLKNMSSTPARGSAETPINMDIDSTDDHTPDPPPVDDDSNLSFSDSNSDADDDAQEEKVTEEATQQSTTSTLLVRYEQGEKRKLGLNDELSQDDSRTTRAKMTLQTNNEDKPSSSEGADAL